MEYYVNTIDDMQNEIDFFYHRQIFYYIPYFVKFLVELFYDTFGYDVLKNNLFLYEIDYSKFLLLAYLFD